MNKYKVNYSFSDKYTYKTHNVDTVYECTEERAEEINNTLKNVADVYPALELLDEKEVKKTRKTKKVDKEDVE